VESFEWLDIFLIDTISCEQNHHTRSLKSTLIEGRAEPFKIILERNSNRSALPVLYENPEL